MRIGVFGGTFNPIHIGHMHIADIAARAWHLDKVLFVPSGDSYMKNSDEMATPFCRLSMVNIACCNDDRFYPSVVDYNRHGPTYAIDTISDIRQTYNDARLFFIMGTDAFNNMPKWKEPKKLATLTDFIVVKRRGESVRRCKKYERGHVFFANDEYDMDISSSYIREAIRCGKSCKYLLPPGVYEYILNHKLYKDWEAMAKA